MAFTGCDDYDDSEILTGLENAEDRLDALEEWQMTAEQRLAAVEAFTAALEGTDYVLGVEEIKDGTTVVGYQIEFKEYGTITVYNGTDGEDGEDGETGAAGANGDSWFSSVTYENGYLVVETSDGTFNLPIYCDIEFAEGTIIHNGKIYVDPTTLKIDFSVNEDTEYRAVYVELIKDGVVTKADPTVLTATLNNSTDEGADDDDYTITFNGLGNDDEYDTNSGIIEITVVLNDGSKSTRSIVFEIANGTPSYVEVDEIVAAIAADPNAAVIVTDMISGTQILSLMRSLIGLMQLSRYQQVSRRVEFLTSLRIQQDFTTETLLSTLSRHRKWVQSISTYQAMLQSI